MMVDYILGVREIVTFTEQYEILEEIKRRTSHNPKVWLGLIWLMAYIGMRPGELRHILEKHINRLAGTIHIPQEHVKDRKPKTIYLIQEDREILKSIPVGMPDLHFFRKPDGACFGQNLIYKWVKKVSKGMGIKIDLYGLTRHTSTTGAGRIHSPDELIDASLHGTNKAFNRYYRASGEKGREVYESINRMRNAQRSGKERKHGS